MNLNAHLYLSEYSLLEYARNKKGHIIGIFVADKVPDYNNYVIKIGWSLCSKLDRFNKETGLHIAYGRLCKNRFDNVPHSLKEKFSKFINRCERYYKKRIVE